MSHGGPVLYLLMFIQTCNVMWQRNKAFNMSAVCATHKRLKLFSNTTHARTSITSVCCFYVIAFTRAISTLINVNYACYQHSILTKAIATTAAHRTSVLSPVVILRKYATLYALDWSIGVPFAVSDKVFSCECLRFSSGVDGVPFCDVTYCDP